MDLFSIGMASKANDKHLIPERFAYVAKKQTIEIFPSGHGWTKQSPTGSTISDDATTYRTGSQGLKLSTTSAMVSCFADKPISTDVENTGIEIDIYIRDASKVSSVEVLLTTSTGFTNYFVGQILGIALRNGWNRIGFLPRLFNKLGTSPPTVEDLASIQKWRIKEVSTTGNGVEDTVDYIKLVQNPLTKGHILITMDDAWDSQWEAKKIMDKYGLRGVAYVITGDYTRKTPLSTRLTYAQLKALDALGWDISSHTVTHRPLPSLSPSELTSELRDSKKWLIDHGFVRGSHHLATPGGQFNPEVLAEVSKYYTTHRTILDGEEFFPPADPMRVKTRQMFNYETESTIKKWIDDCATHNYVLVLTTHRFVTTPTADVEMSLSLFDTICAYIAGKVTAGTAVNATWSDLVSQVSPL